MLGGAASAAMPAWLGGCAGVPIQQSSQLLRGVPAEYGVDARAVLTFLDEASASGLELHSIMLYRHGHVVTEGWWWPYRDDRRHMMHSLTKSVTACAVGWAIEEGRFALGDRVVDFFADELPPKMDPRVRRMTVRDLLTMQTGHGVGVSGSVWRQIRTSWITEFFKLPIVHEPGTTFVYNSAASFMLSALVTKCSGQTARDYLTSRFFQPLGIDDLSWDLSPGGINPGGNGLSWSTQDSLKLGIVHLQGGRWQGRQVLPSQWVEDATRAQIPGGFYGYQWWVSPAVPSFYAWGLFGQFSFVFPEHDAVLAITAGTQGDKLPPLVWKYFPRAFDAARVDITADSLLATRCAQLRLLMPLVPGASPRASRISGRTFTMEPNEDGVVQVRLKFTDQHCLFYLRDDRGEHCVIAGMQDWFESDTTMTGAKLHHEYEPRSMRVVAGGRWRDEHTFDMTWQFVETAFQDRMVCTFGDDTLRLDRSVNVNSAATSRPTLRGTLAGPG